MNAGEREKKKLYTLFASAREKKLVSLFLLGCRKQSRTQLINTRLLKVVTIAQISVQQESNITFVQNVVRSGDVMDTNQRQIALSVLESLREDLMYAHLNNGGRVLDVADLRQYIYEQMGRIRTNALMLDGLYGNNNGHGQDISKGNGHNGKAQS